MKGFGKYFNEVELFIPLAFSSMKREERGRLLVLAQQTQIKAGWPSPASKKREGAEIPGSPRSQPVE